MATKKRSGGGRKSVAGTRSTKTTKVTGGKKKAARKVSRKPVSGVPFEPVGRRGGPGGKSAKGKASKVGAGKESAGGFTFQPTRWAAAPGKAAKKKAPVLPFQPPKKPNKP